MESLLFMQGGAAGKVHVNSHALPQDSPISPRTGFGAIAAMFIWPLTMLANTDIHTIQTMCTAAYTLF